MLNENQHKLLALPNIQELLKSGDWELHDGGEKVRSDVSNRVQGWLTKAEVETKPRIIATENPVSKNPEDVKNWIDKNIAVHGKDWSPF